MDKIQKRVRASARKIAEEMTDEQLFGSEDFKAYIQYLIKAFVPDEDIEFFYQRYEDEIAAAYTNGKKLFASWDNTFTRSYNDQESRFFTILGLVFHEIGHVLFTDFASFTKGIRNISNGYLPAGRPKADSLHEDQMLSEIEEALHQESYQSLFSSIYKELENSVLDPHDERKMVEKFGAFVERAIFYMKETLRTSIIPLEKKMTLGRSELELALDVAFEYARFKTVSCLDYGTVTSNSVVNAVLARKDWIEKARDTDDQTERFHYLTKIITLLWPFIKDSINQQNENQNSAEDSSSENEQEQNEDQNAESEKNMEIEKERPSEESNGSQGPSEETASISESEEAGTNGVPNEVPKLSDEQLQSLLEKIQEAAKEAGQTAEPENRTTRPEAKSGNQSESQENVSNPENQWSEEEQSNSFNHIKEQIAESIAEEQLEDEWLREAIKDIRAINANSPHKLYPVRVFTHENVPQHKVNKYSEIKKSIAGYSARLQRSIMDELRDMEDGDIDHGLFFGNTIETRYAYRPDNRFFANKKIPYDIPEMAISVLVDMSGSMTNFGRAEAAREAAILLEDFAKGLGIPVSVTGHTTRGRQVYYHIFKTFDSLTEKSRFSLAEIQGDSDGCNRDGAAIEIAASMLEKRPEEIKMMFIISDGQPYHIGYSGEKAAEDIRAIIKKHKRNGVETIACAIGDDKDKIKSIYKEDFLDVSDLSKLPRTMALLVKKRLLS